MYLVTNKSDAQSPWEDNPDPRVYFSLSDYYWPFQVSSVNPNGLPYRYNATVNPKVCSLCPSLSLSYKAFLDDVHTAAVACAYHCSTSDPTQLWKVGLLSVPVMRCSLITYMYCNAATPPPPV